LNEIAKYKSGEIILLANNDSIHRINSSITQLFTFFRAATVFPTQTTPQPNPILTHTLPGCPLIVPSYFAVCRKSRKVASFGRSLRLAPHRQYKP